MTPKRAIIITSILLTVFISVFAIDKFERCGSCKDEIKRRYAYNKISGPEIYSEDCATEFQNNIRFPIDKPAFAKLHFDQLTRPPVTLDSNQTRIILNALNDTSSYVWGELGTPHFDRHFTFHDKEGNCIGYTDFSFDGQTYSTPSLAKMKWGMLTDTARFIIMTAIDSRNLKSARGRQKVDR